MYPGEKQPVTTAEVKDFVNRCAESYARLCGYAKSAGINIIIENHGGISSKADVVADLMKTVNLPNCGTLPDFGNFPKDADRYEEVRKMMPYAKGVSFKEVTSSKVSSFMMTSRYLSRILSIRLRSPSPWLRKKFTNCFIKAKNFCIEWAVGLRRCWLGFPI